MSFQHALSTNNYGPYKLIVSSDPANGTHTTLASALAAASSGDTIFLRNSVTEDVTITQSVGIVGGINEQIEIKGKITVTAVDPAQVHISNVYLTTNGDYSIVNNGTIATNVVIQNCYCNVADYDFLSFTNSSASSFVQFFWCKGNIATTGVKFFTCTGPNVLNFDYTVIQNGGGSSTQSSASTTRVNLQYTTLIFPIITSSTGTVFGHESWIYGEASNVAGLTTAGTGGQNLHNCYISGGTDTALVVGSGTTVNLFDCQIRSSNATAISGAGSISYNQLAFDNTSSEVTVTTQAGLHNRYGINRSSTHPAFLATLAADKTNVTGDNTTYTIPFDTETFDQNSNFNTGTYTFTAPVAGRYLLYVAQSSRQYTSSHTYGRVDITTTAQNYFANTLSPAKVYETYTGATIWTCSASIICNMAASDTATARITVAGGTKVVDVEATSTGINTFFGGYLIC